MSFKNFEYITNNTVFCIGSGPSARSFNFDILVQDRHAKTIIVVNRVMDKIPHANFAITCDTSVLKSYLPYVLFNGIKIAAMYKDFGQLNAIQEFTRGQLFNPNIFYIKREDNAGLSTDRSYVNGLANSGFGALGLAFHMIRDSSKNKRIVLIGYDFKHHQSYWYDNSKLRDKDFPHRERQMSQFLRAKEQLESENIEVINCSPGSDLPFAISSLNQVQYL